MNLKNKKAFPSSRFWQCKFLKRNLRAKGAMPKFTTGFTLIEIIMVIAILAILGVIGFASYYNFQANISVDEEANRIVEVLRQARQNAIAGQDLLPWGVHFVYATSSVANNKYYILFEGSSFSTATTSSSYNLGSGLFFVNPIASSTIDVIFNSRSGTSASSSDITISINNTNVSSTKNILITTRGVISKQ